MQVEVAVRHGHLSPEHMLVVKERAGNLVHYYDRLTFIQVTADVGGDLEKSVEIHCKCEHAHDFVGVGVGPDVMAAFVAAKDKVKQQLRHHKERTQDHRRDPSHDGVRG